VRIRVLNTCLIGAALTLTLALAAPAAAQQPSRPATGGDEQTMLVGAGLTFMDWGDTGVGFAANALFNALKITDTGRIGVVGDFGLNHFRRATATSFMGGVRYTFTTKGKVIPYGQFLAGIVHCCGHTSFDPGLGFGADIAWQPNLNVRGEVQWIFDDTTATRFFIGVSLPVHKRR
jgi:hypothetical protein